MRPSHRNPWERFLAVALPVFRSEARWAMVGGVGLIVTCLLGMSGLNVLSSYVGRDFMNALARGRQEEFGRYALLYLGVFAVSTAVVVLKQYTEERLGLFWREWLTTHLLGRYLAGKAYLRVDRRDDIDNPDQRLTEDVRTFTITTLSFCSILTNSTLMLVAFLGVLWSITPWLVAAAVGYAAFGSVMTVLLGRRLVHLNFLQLKKEADLRFRLIQVRENDEAIAFHGSEGAERGHVLRRLAVAVENYLQIVRVNRNLNVFARGYEYVTQILPVLVVAPLFFRGEIEFGVVTQSMFAFTFVLGAFSVIITQFQAISSFAAVAVRLSGLIEAMEATPTAGAEIERAEDPDRVAFEHLTLATPKDEQELVRDLSLEVRPGRRVLVTGPNGAGKSALFRAAAGIWCWGRGRVVVPPPGDVLFLPHQPYVVPGTLRDQLLYALPRDRVGEAEVHRVLAEVKLDSAVARVGGLDIERDWGKLLSKGQLQRLGLARVLLARPKFAFLDGATSALDAFWVKTLYGVLSETDITYLTIGDHPDLVKYHDLVLELCGDGTWHAGTEPTGCGRVVSRS
jgi:putative ATP-binding cassette transporter